MEDAGQRLRGVRERLKLRVRDVQLATQQIAEKYKNDEYVVLINRVSEIENRNLVPSIYKLYSLCVVYHLDFQDVLEWFGISLGSLPADAAHFELPATHPISFHSNREALMPLSFDPGIDLRRTTYLSRMIQRWGKLPLTVLDGLNLKEHRYAYIGSDDWFMHPLLQPGALVMIDDSLRKISNSGWNSEFERPIYFVEHRQGYICAWCNLSNDQLILQPHGSSPCSPEVYDYPKDAEIIGQIVGVAMRLNERRQRRTRDRAAGS
jgi:hypothetical protein